MNAIRLLALSALVGLGIASATRADAPTATSPDGKRLATADGMKVSITDTATGKILVQIAGNTNVTAIRFSPDGKLLVTASADNTVRMFDDVGREQFRIAKTPPGITSLTFTADGKTLIAGDKDKVLRKWEVATGKEVKE